MPEHVSHEQIFSRIENAEDSIIRSEERTVNMVKWLAGGFSAVAFAAVTWGMGERAEQVKSNSVAAERFGQATARQEEITKRLDDISDLIRAESQLTREMILRHESNRHAHEQNPEVAK